MTDIPVIRLAKTVVACQDIWDSLEKTDITVCGVDITIQLTSEGLRELFPNEMILRTKYNREYDEIFTEYGGAKFFALTEKGNKGGTSC